MYSSPVEIHPGGVSDKYLIDLMCMLQRSMYGLCAKLDAEAAGLDTYVANCYTAIFHHVLTDYAGNRTADPTNVDYIISPMSGLPPGALTQWCFDYANALETLTEQLDGDALITDDNDYEDNCYHAIVFPYQFESKDGTIIGNDNSSGGFSSTPAAGGWGDGAEPYIMVKIGPTGKPSDRVLADLFYDFINAWETLCEQIDADATAGAPPADTDYEALWYTATVLMRVANSSGNVLGNAQTRLG
jgi:hypothetical protein